MVNVVVVKRLGRAGNMLLTWGIEKWESAGFIGRW
jgi:hypothetical protein